MLLAIAALVRLVHLADNPGWDGDEGYNWSIAANLALGHVQRFALRYTFVDHPPLFYLLGAALCKVWTQDLVALRTLSALCGVAATLGTYALGTRVGGTRLGLLAATFYALWPQAILQTRWAYTYDLVTPLLLFALWAALPPWRAATDGAEGVTPRASCMAGLLAGLALATDQEAIAVAATVLLVLWWRGGMRAAAVGLASAIGPPALYILWMLGTRAGAFLFDLRHTATRVGGHGVLGEAITLLARFVHLCQFDALIGFGLYGLLLAPRGLARRALLTQAALLLVVVLQVRDPNPYLRAAVPLLPLCALGVALLAVAAWRGVAPFLRARTRRLLLGASVVAGALLWAYDLAQASGEYTTALAASLPRSTADARAVAAWVNRRVRPSDLVIAMPQTAWLFRCHAAEILEAVAITGRGTAFYPPGLSRDRFAYDTHLSASRFVVVDDFTRLWIRENAAERALVLRVSRGWPVVYRRGEYVVYANPSPGPSPRGYPTG